MNTNQFVRDRREVAELNALSSGTGVPTNLRDASNTGLANAGGHWKNPPTPIMKPSAGRQTQSYTQGRSRAQALNPFAGDSLSTTLHGGRGKSGAGFDGRDGNMTASRTILGRPNGNSSASRFHPHTGHPAKRQKTTHPTTSRYFDHGAQGTGKGKGKGKERAYEQAPSDAETISGDEQDVGKLLPKGQVDGQRGTAYPSREGSPDPLDVISASSDVQEVHGPPHPFDAPSKRGPNRLPPDGASTLRLQQRQKERAAVEPPLVVDLDAEVPSDDIETVSDWEKEDAAAVRRKGRANTPRGRSDIPEGVVKSRRTTFETKQNGVSTVRNPIRFTDTPPDEKPKASPQEEPPFVDLHTFEKPKTGIVAKMRKKNEKAAPSLRQFNQGRMGETLDPVATSSSGFVSRKETVPEPLPLEAWSFGCQLFPPNDSLQPVAWLRIQHIRNRNIYMLGVVSSAEDRQPQYSWHLDRDFDEMTYTEYTDGWGGDPVVVIRLQSTKSMTVSRKGLHMQPGSKRAPGWVTFKCMVRHANWYNGKHYKALVDLLKTQIAMQSTLRGYRAAAGCWQETEAAAGRARDLLESTRSDSTASRQSPISAGPSRGSSTTVQVPESASVSAPPSRTYTSSAAAERRVTRQSTRSSRASPSPDLDELVLVYPFTGTGAVNITRGDLKRLDDGQYLNDTIIEFGLKVWLDDLRKAQPELAEQVHIFNSFFYKKLSSKREVADTYASVRKWTSKVDIFSKKYIIVPINENFHWYLAIIENPANMLHPPPPEARIVPQTRKRKRDSAASVPETESKREDQSISKQPSEQPPEKPPEVVPELMAIDGESENEGLEVETMLHFSQSCNITESNGVLSAEESTRSVSRDITDIGSVELQYPGSEEPMEVDPVPGSDEDSAKDSTRRKPSVMLPEPIVIEDDADDGNIPNPSTSLDEDLDASKEEQTPPRNEDDASEQTMPVVETSENPICWIFTFDSLGSKHPAVGKHLSKYLQYEAVDKKNYQIEDTTIATVKHAKAPMQTNFCDCGLFVLAFVEAFMKDPARASDLIRKNQSDWYSGDQSGLREGFRHHTIELCEQWKKDRAAKEGNKDEVGDKDKAKEQVKSKVPEAEIIEDSDDEIVISEVIPAPTKNKGGKKGNSGKATRLRG